MDEVTVEVLGCGDAFASGGRMNSCFYVHSSESSYSFLIDCGVTSLLALKKNGISTCDIDMIAISHFHGDHFGGLPFFILDAGVRGRSKPLAIVSPPGGKEKLAQAIEIFYPGSSEYLEIFPIDYLSYQVDEPVTCGEVEISAFPVVHSEQTLPHGLRIVFRGKVIGYSGDTSWTDALLDIAKDADLFICECNFFDRETKGHLNYLTLQAKRPLLSCKRMMLTHFGEEMLKQQAGIEMDHAWEGRRLVL